MENDTFSQSVYESFADFVKATENRIENHICVVQQFEQFGSQQPL